jgi:hypothetical protein
MHLVLHSHGNKLGSARALACAEWEKPHPTTHQTRREGDRMIEVAIRDELIQIRVLLELILQTIEGLYRAVLVARVAR